VSVQIAYERGILRSQSAASAVQATPAARWGAVWALTLCIATLIASEFMPVSLLTPIAADCVSGYRLGRRLPRREGAARAARRCSMSARSGADACRRCG
jgi:hypothetical protein